MFDLEVDNETNDVSPGCSVCVTSGLPGEPLFPDESLFDFVTAKEVLVLNSLDPNDKEGPAGNEGEGDLNVIALGQVLDYTIRFENDESAAQPANKIEIFDRLEEKLDLFTFEMQGVNIGNSSGGFEPANSSSAYGDTTDLTISGGEGNAQRIVAVTVEWILDLNTRWITWTLETKTINGVPPTGEADGFLEAGENGSISFRIAPGQEATFGTSIENEATILFDGVNPMRTGTWSNVIGSVSGTGPGEVTVTRVEPQPCVGNPPTPRASDDTLKDDAEAVDNPMPKRNPAQIFR